MGWGEGASRMKESEKLFSVEMQVGHKETENLAARHKAVPTLPKSQRKRREGGGGRTGNALSKLTPRTGFKTASGQ